MSDLSSSSGAALPPVEGALPPWGTFTLGVPWGEEPADGVEGLLELPGSTGVVGSVGAVVG